MCAAISERYTWMQKKVENLILVLCNESKGT